MATVSSPESWEELYAQKRQPWELGGFDFSPAALRHARTLARIEAVSIEFVHMDLFELPRRYTGVFDGVWEYTCFCAIDPARRADYVAVVDASSSRAAGSSPASFPSAATGKAHRSWSTSMKRADCSRPRFASSENGDRRARRRDVKAWSGWFTQ